MAKVGTLFNVADNTGVKRILCVANLTRKNNNIFLGDKIVGIVKNIDHSSKLIYSFIVYGIVIRIKKNSLNSKKYNMCFNDNVVVLIDKNSNIIGSRIFGSVPKYLKEKNYLKLNSLSISYV